MASFSLPPGIELYYEDHGHGQPIVLIHGLCVDQSVQDYRSMLRNVTVPTLLCFGRHDKLVRWQQGNICNDTCRVLGW